MLGWVSVEAAVTEGFPSAGKCIWDLRYGKGTQIDSKLLMG